MKMGRLLLAAILVIAAVVAAPVPDAAALQQPAQEKSETVPSAAEPQSPGKVQTATVAQEAAPPPAAQELSLDKVLADKVAEKVVAQPPPATPTDAAGGQQTADPLASVAKDVADAVGAAVDSAMGGPAQPPAAALGDAAAATRSDDQYDYGDMSVEAKLSLLTTNVNSPHTVESISAGLDNNKPVQQSVLEDRIKILRTFSQGGGMIPSEYLKFAQAINQNPGKDVLVYGLGFDSGLYDTLNRGGSTYFIENNLDWINKADAKTQSLSYNDIKYSTKLSTYKNFLAHPYMNTNVELFKTKSCFDVVLVDSPMGYVEEGKDHPGRQQPMFMTATQAAQCLDSGKLESVRVFVHDVNRIGEDQMSNFYFGKNNMVSETNVNGNHDGARGLREFVLKKGYVVPKPMSAAQLALIHWGNEDVAADSLSNVADVAENNPSAPGGATDVVAASVDIDSSCAMPQGCQAKDSDGARVAADATGAALAQLAAVAAGPGPAAEPEPVVAAMANPAPPAPVAATVLDVAATGAAGEDHASPPKEDNDGVAVVNGEPPRHPNGHSHPLYPSGAPPPARTVTLPKVTQKATTTDKVVTHTLSFKNYNLPKAAPPKVPREAVQLSWGPRV